MKGMNLAVSRLPRCNGSTLFALFLTACLANINLACDAQQSMPSSSPRNTDGSNPSEAAPNGTAPKRPNILLFIVDTLRADALGPYRGDLKQTPEIGKVARDAIVFENAFAQSSWTRASGASILAPQ